MYKVKETLINRYCSTNAEAAAEYFGCDEDELNNSDNTLFWFGDSSILVTLSGDDYTHRIEVLEELNPTDFENGYQKRINQ